jgi:hypothetical protein
MLVHLDTDIGFDTDDMFALAMLLRWGGVEIAGISTSTEIGGKRAAMIPFRGLSQSSLPYLILVLSQRGLTSPGMRAGDSVRHEKRTTQSGPRQAQKIALA